MLESDTNYSLYGIDFQGNELPNKCQIPTAKLGKTNKNLDSVTVPSGEMKKSFPQMPRKAEAHEAFARFFGGSGRWAAGCQSVCTALRRKSGGAVQLPAPCGPGPAGRPARAPLSGGLAARGFLPLPGGADRKMGKKKTSGRTRRAASPLIFNDSGACGQVTRFFGCPAR